MNLLKTIISDKKAWYNPFVYIAGTKALWIGLLIILLTSIAGQYSGVYFPGVTDGKIGWEGSFSMHLSLSVIAWLALVMVFYPLARILSASKVRLADIAGTQALARAPMLLSALLGYFTVVKKVTDSLLYSFVEELQGLVEIDLPPVRESGPVATWEYMAAALVGLAFVVATVWMVALMYHAYRVSSGLKGTRLVVSFILGMLVAQAISNIAIYYWVQWAGGLIG